jgi:hypothetical protein
VVYAGHPTLPQVYFPAGAVNMYLLKERVLEHVRLLRDLGAEEIEIDAVDRDGATTLDAALQLPLTANIHGVPVPVGNVDAASGVRRRAQGTASYFWRGPTSPAADFDARRYLWLASPGGGLGPNGGPARRSGRAVRRAAGCRQTTAAGGCLHAPKGPGPRGRAAPTAPPGAGRRRDSPGGDALAAHPMPVQQAADLLFGSAPRQQPVGAAARAADRPQQHDRLVERRPSGGAAHGQAGDARRQVVGARRMGRAPVDDVEAEPAEQLGRVVPTSRELRRGQRLPTGQEAVGHADDRLRVVFDAVVDQHVAPCRPESVGLRERVSAQPVELLDRPDDLRPRDVR